MNTYLEQIYDENQLKDITYLIYKNFKNNKTITNSFFDCCFDYPYEMIFGDEDIDASIYYLLKNYYKNEYFIKRSFYNKVLSKKESIVLFELPLEKSRLDIASVNGKAIAYEIKTEFDNLNRLENQINDYLLYFEYVYIICNKEKVEEVFGLIPSEVGVYVYNEKITDNGYTLIKKASMNSNINIDKIISFIGKKDSRAYFKSIDQEYIKNTYSKDYIYNVFKQTFRKRYNKKSSIIKEKCEALKNV